MEGDRIYFRTRAKQERRAAMRAASDDAREAHLDLARRYDELAAGPGAAGKRPEIAV